MLRDHKVKCLSSKLWQPLISCLDSVRLKLQPSRRQQRVRVAFSSLKLEWALLWNLKHLPNLINGRLWALLKRHRSSTTSARSINPMATQLSSWPHWCRTATPCNLARAPRARVTKPRFVATLQTIELSSLWNAGMKLTPRFQKSQVLKTVSLLELMLAMISAPWRI